MSRNIIIIVVVALVVLSGGIGAYVLMKKDNKENSSQTESNYTYSDACNVFTTKLLADALGGEYTNGETDTSVLSSDGLRGSVCKFDQRNDGTANGVAEALNVTVGIDNYKSLSNADAFMKKLHDPQSSEANTSIGKPTDVDDVGDQAFFPGINTASAVAEKNETLYVRVGRQVIVINATRQAGVDREMVRYGLRTIAGNL